MSTLGIIAASIATVTLIVVVVGIAVNEIKNHKS